MQKSLKAILAEERDSRLITNLCEKFGYANPQFVGNNIIVSEANPQELLCLIVERYKDAARVGATLIPLQTILQDKLGIKVELLRKEQIKEIFFETIMAHVITILESEDKFREYFSNNIDGINFDELVYEPLVRDDEFDKDLQRVKRILEKKKINWDSPILFPQNIMKKPSNTNESLEAKQEELNPILDEITPEQAKSNELAIEDTLLIRRKRQTEIPLENDFESSLNEPAIKRKKLS